MWRARRRLCVAAACLAWPWRTQAATKPARIAFISGAALDDSIQKNLVDPFVQGLRELGHVEGRSIAIDYRWADGQPQRLPALVRELLAAEPRLIVAAGPAPAWAAQRATATLPIVAVAVDNPVQMGLAQSMARPGGNITGISSFGVELVARRLQLLKDLVPGMRRAAVLMNPATVQRAGVDSSLRDFEPRLGYRVDAYEARGPEDFDAAFAAIKREQVGGLLVLADATFWTHRARLAELVLAHKMPSVWGGRDYLQDAGLASYQSDFRAMFRRAAALVDQVLNGANPSDMPFEQATRLELVVNLRAARALGITVPRTVLASADEVIE